MSRRPTAELAHGGDVMVTTPSSAEAIELIGVEMRGGDVAFTAAESDALDALYGVKPHGEALTDRDRKRIAFERVGTRNDVIRCAQRDGLRIVAWLSRYLEPGEDPLKTVIRACATYGFDVRFDGEWAESEESEETNDDAEQVA